MKISKTALKELSRLYGVVLRKCLFLNMLVLGTMGINIAKANISITEDQSWNLIEANAHLNNAGVVSVENSAQVNIAGTKEDVNTNPIFSELIIKSGSSFNVETPTDANSDANYGYPGKGQINFNIDSLTVEEEGVLSLSSDYNHFSDISDLNKADLSGTINLKNSRIEGDMETIGQKISLDGATVNMNGKYANMEATQIDIKNSTIEADVEDHGFVSATDLTVDNSVITLNNESHLINYDGNLNGSGALTLNNSTLTLTGGSATQHGSFLYGESIQFNGSTINANGGNNYFFSTKDGEISLNSQGNKETLLTVGKGAKLSVYGLDTSIFDLDEEFDEDSDTISNIVDIYKTELGTGIGELTLNTGSRLDVQGNLYSDVNMAGGDLTVSGKIDGTVNIQDSDAIVNGNLVGSSLNIQVPNFSTDNLNGNVSLETLKIVGSEQSPITFNVNKEMSARQIQAEHGVINLKNTDSEERLEFWANSENNPEEIASVDMSDTTLDMENFDLIVKGNTTLTNVKGIMNNAGIDSNYGQDNTRKGDLALSGENTQFILDNSELQGADLTISDGRYTAKNYSEITGEKTANYTGGNIVLDRAMIGATGENSIVGNVEYHTNGKATFGENNTLSVRSGLNKLIGKTITMSNTTDIKKGASLETAESWTIDNDTEEETYGDPSTIALNGGTINLEGTLKANLATTDSEHAGTLKIKDSSARLNGNMTGVNLVIDSDYNTRNIIGTMTDMADIKISADKTLKLDSSDSISGDSLTIEQGATFSSSKNKLYISDLNVDDIYLSGTFNTNYENNDTNLSVMNQNAKIMGDLSGVSLYFNADKYDTAKNITGKLSNLNMLSIDDNKQLTLTLNSSLLGKGEENLYINSFHMGTGSGLNLYGANNSSSDWNIKALRDVYGTGTINLTNASVIQEDSGRSFQLSGATVNAKNSSIISRSTNQKMTLSDSTLSLDYGIFEKLHDGDMEISGSTVNLSKTKGKGAFISRIDWEDGDNVSLNNASEGSGDIRIISGSHIIMNDNSAIIRGNWSDYNERTKSIVYDEASGHGNIDVKLSTITMNSNAQIVMNTSNPTSEEETTGSVLFNEGSTLNVNGNNKIYFRKAQEDQQISFLGTHEDEENNTIGSTLNIAKGATLSVLTDKGYTAPSIYGDENATVNLKGVLNASILNAGNVIIDGDKAKLNGQVGYTTQLVLQNANANINSIITGKSNQAQNLTISGNGTGKVGKYTLNNSMFKNTDEDEAVYWGYYNYISSANPYILGTLDDFDVENYKYYQVDNQFENISITNGGSLSTTKTLYTDSLSVDNASFVSSALVGVSSLALNNATATFKGGFQFADSEDNSLQFSNSTLNLGGKVVLDDLSIGENEKVNFISDSSIKNGSYISTGVVNVSGNLNITATNNDLEWSIMGGLNILDGGAFTVNLYDPKKRDIDIDINSWAYDQNGNSIASYYSTAGSTIKLLSDYSAEIELYGNSFDLAGNITLKSAILEGYESANIGEEEANSETTTLIADYSDFEIPAHGYNETYVKLMDSGEKKELNADLKYDYDNRNNSDKISDFGRRILNALSNIPNMSYSETEIISLPNEASLTCSADASPILKYVNSQGETVIHQYTEDSGFDMYTDLKDYYKSLYTKKDIYSLKYALNDIIVELSRENSASDLTINHTKAELKNGTEVGRFSSGDTIINSSTVTLKKGTYSSTISNEGKTGDIEFNDSTVNLNNDTFIVRGLYKWDEKGFSMSPGIAASSGDIVFDNTTLNMNGTSSVNLSDTTGRIIVKNGSIINVNGNNKFNLVNKASEFGGSVFLESDPSAITTLNINKGATLSLIKGSTGYSESYMPAIYGEAGTLIDVKGTLNADISTEGDIFISANNAKITGIIKNANNLNIKNASGEIGSFVSGNLKNKVSLGVIDLYLSGKGSKTTLNNAVFGEYKDLARPAYSYQKEYPAEKWWGDEEMTQTEAEEATRDAKAITDKSDSNYHRQYALADNHLADLTITEGATLSTNKTLYLDNLELNKGTFSSSNLVGTDTLSLTNGSNATLKGGFAAFATEENSGEDYAVDIDGSTLTASNYFEAESVKIANNATLNTSNVDFDTNRLLIQNSKWNATDTYTEKAMIGNMSSEYPVIVSGKSIANIKNSYIIAENSQSDSDAYAMRFVAEKDDPTIEETTNSATPQITVSKNSFVGGNTFLLGTASDDDSAIDRAKLTASDNSIIGALRIGLKQEYGASGEAYPVLNTLSLKAEVNNADIILNGNSSFALGLLSDNELKNGNWQYSLLAPKTYYQKYGEENYTDLNDHVGSILMNNGSNIILNNTASIVNNSLTHHSETIGEEGGDISFNNKTILTVNGKNTIAATGDILLEGGSELHVNKGSILTLNSDYDFDNNDYANHQIDIESATVKIAGTLKGTLNFTDDDSTLILGEGYKVDGLSGNNLKGIGVSGVTSAKSLAKLSQDLVGFDFNEFTITDKSNLSTVLLSSILARTDTLNVKNNSTLTVNGDLTVNQLAVDKSNLNINEASLTVDSVNLTNSNLTMSAKNNSNIMTSLSTKGADLSIINDPNTKATVNLTNASIDLSGTQSLGNMTLTNSSLKVAGNAKKIETEDAHFIRVNELTVSNTNNAKASVNLSNIVVKGLDDSENLSTMNFMNVSSIILNNVIGDYLNVQNGKSLSITNQGYADVAVNNVDTITMQKTELDSLTINKSKKLTLSDVIVQNDNPNQEAMTLTNVDSIALNNVKSDNLTVQNAKSLNISDKITGDEDFDDIDINSVDTITMNGIDFSDLVIDQSKKLTLANVNMGTTALTDVQKFDFNKVIADDLTIGVSEGNETTISNRDTSREKVVYHSVGALTNTTLESLTLDNTYLTVNKGNNITGALTVQDTQHTGDARFDAATYIAVKDNLNVGSVAIKSGTLEVAKGKTLTVHNGLTTGTSANNGGELVLYGTLKGNITQTNGAAVKIMNSTGKIDGNADLRHTELRVKTTSGNLSKYITGDLTLGNLMVRDGSNLTLDKYFQGEDNEGNLHPYSMKSLEITNSQLHLREHDGGNTYTVQNNFDMNNGKLYLGTTNLHVNGITSIGAKSTIYIDVDDADTYGQLNTNTLRLETYQSGKNTGKLNNITLSVTMPRQKMTLDGETKFNFITYNELTDQNGITDSVKGPLNITIANNRYLFVETDVVGQYKVSATTNGKGVIEKYSEIYDSNPVQVANMSFAMAAIESADENSSATDNAIADSIHALSQQVGSERLLAEAVSALSPEDEGAVQQNEISTIDTMMNTVSSRLSSGTSMMGLNAGDSIGNNGNMWVQALYNHTKLSQSDGYAGFKGNSRGMAMGIGFDFTKTIKGGLAYQYMDTDIKTGNRKMNVDTHGLALYGEYKPNHWFVNGIAGFNFSDYDSKAESVLGATNSDFDVYTYSVQTATGYEFDLADKVKMTPSVGLRYALLVQDDYTDSDGKRISSDKNNILTFRMGDKLAWEYTTDKGTHITPEIYLGMSYDLHTDQSQSIVTLSNGSNYQVDGRNLKRFGVNGGLGTKITSDAWDFTFGADMDVRQDYRSYTGSFKAKYHF